MEEQYLLVRRLGLGRVVECSSLVVKRYLAEVDKMVETRVSIADIVKDRSEEVVSSEIK